MQLNLMLVAIGNYQKKLKVDLRIIIFLKEIYYLMKKNVLLVMKNVY